MAGVEEQLRELNIASQALYGTDIMYHVFTDCAFPESDVLLHSFADPTPAQGVFNTTANAAARVEVEHSIHSQVCQ